MGTDTTVFHQGFLPGTAFPWKCHWGCPGLHPHLQQHDCELALPVWPGGFPKSKFTSDPAADGLLSPDSGHLAHDTMQVTRTAGKKGNQSTPELNCSTAVMLGDYDTNTRIKIPPGDTKPTLIQSKSAFQALYCLATPGRDPSVSFRWVFVCSLQTNVQKKSYCSSENSEQGEVMVSIKKKNPEKTKKTQRKQKNN